MRKYISPIISLLLLASIGSVAQAEYNKGDILKPLVRRGNRLMLRAEPSRDSGIKSKLYGRDHIEVVADQGDWIKVRTSNGQTGYIHRGFATVVTPAKSPASVVPMSGRFTLDNVNSWASLLPSPSSSYDNRISRVPLGQELEAVGKDQSTGRVKVKYTKDGRTYEGWVDSKRLREAKLTNTDTSETIDGESDLPGTSGKTGDRGVSPFGPGFDGSSALPATTAGGPSEVTNPEANSEIPPLPEANPRRDERPQTSMSDGVNPRLAAALTSCASYGIRNSGRGMCAKGVRLAISCAANKAGMPELKGTHCGASAIDYAGKGCLEKKGFRNDMNQCNTPGVIRVYDGICSKRNGGRCLKGYSRKYSGDYHGHIEFLGTDKKWHSFYSSRHAIDSPNKMGKRRRLVACYVK